MNSGHNSKLNHTKIVL